MTPSLNSGLKSNPLVSIVVPTFNAGAHIERLAESIRHQTYQNIEVTIVDNFSRDQAVLDHLNLEAAIIYAASGMAEARNIGALRSRGSYLLHLDADMELSPTLVAECVRICELGLADAIIIPEVSAGTGFWATCAGLQKVLSPRAQNIPNNFSHFPPLGTSKFLRNSSKVQAIWPHGAPTQGQVRRVPGGEEVFRQARSPSLALSRERPCTRRRLHSVVSPRKDFGGVGSGARSCVQTGDGMHWALHSARYCSVERTRTPLEYTTSEAFRKRLFWKGTPA